MQNFSFNTYVAALMAFRNVLQEAKRTSVVGSLAWETATKTMLLLLAPAAPHLTEELWAKIGGPFSIHQQAWPKFDPELAAEDEITIVVQVNGKVRDRFQAAPDIQKDEAIAQAHALEGVQRFIEGKTVVKEIYVPQKLVNIVVRG
jgi:leucyl-tRNA synthetase